MPVLDGFDTAKNIRDYEKLKGLSRIPMYAMSAASGMDGLLKKPIKPAELKAILIK
ncbi:response regulator receiver domain protein [Ichthyophthirius multifiliis]|uniref:Response regulator receiver domain protein n=1 Tax=Ichthyophthirius multifiliis TaxID=5932 RepID=G0QLW5_ICHMU|nr:response regulator receiver domain protein [Ichthyophthirius multifiliis]EGR33793.1 response regulator receiver domain protein [Ichthyophthirius multifiliis]|eukprot:XP_004039017.1 response regulator receiver domain protein [Ichthyophthirius multifiliis]